MKNNLGNKEVMAKNIRRYMELHDKTRSDLCSALGIRYTTLSDWLNAKTYPRIDKIEIMANYFGIKKSDLVEPASPADEDTKPGYYIDEETARIADELKENPGRRVLFDAARKLSPESIKEVQNYIEYLYQKQDGSDD